MTVFTQRETHARFNVNALSSGSHAARTKMCSMSSMGSLSICDRRTADLEGP